jgi:hypothetical protein
MRSARLVPTILLAFLFLTGTLPFSACAIADPSQIALRLQELLRATGDQLCRGNIDAIVDQFPPAVRGERTDRECYGIDSVDVMAGGCRLALV